MVLFAMLGTLMFVSDIAMEALPNIHLVGMLTILYTVVYRAKALLPIYLYVFLNGIYMGFSAWWVSYLYVWTLLWGAAMLIPKNLSPTAAKIIYPAVCSLHGFLFGILYAPGIALALGGGVEMMVGWIIAGAAFDITMGVGNLFAGMLVYPLVPALRRLNG